jgi:site-specific recombinase XerD
VSDELLVHVDSFHAEMKRRPRDLPPDAPLAHSWMRALDLLFVELRAKGLLSALPGEALNPQLVEYLEFLRRHCGFAPSTIRRHKDDVGRFLRHLGPKRALASLTIKEVDAFIIEASHTRSRRSMASVCGALRGFLGHLYRMRILPRDLREHVVAPRIYSLENLPRSIPWRDVERTVELVRRGTGRRDYAILALLAFCGLRANEVASLRLEHIDWRRDVIHLHRPKTRMMEEMPLVPRVGEALVAYLRKRPTTSHRQIFMTSRAPIAPLGRSPISLIARKHLRRAGVEAPHLGAHTLRHAHAMHLLRQGFSLKAIGDALGHHHPSSTLVYTKGAVDDLREVAQEIGEVAS